MSLRLRLARVSLIVVVLAALVAGYFTLVLNWSYADGERAGWVQKLSRKGWFCKTWEGEMAMVSMPGAATEKFYFTVHDAAVAARINALLGRRVSLHYEQKVGLPTSCFGDTRHFVTAVKVVEEIPLVPGVVVPVPPARPEQQPSATQPPGVPQPPAAQPPAAQPPAAQAPPPQ